ncbi:hypothetical protein E4U57_001916, partial [Claviceps arundinis]
MRKVHLVLPTSGQTSALQRLSESKSDYWTLSSVLDLESSAGLRSRRLPTMGSMGSEDII